VHNHVGASGAQALEAFGAYFTDRYGTFWGRAINYDDALATAPASGSSRRARRGSPTCIVDGFRLDAIHAVYDMSARHVLAQFADRVHAARPGALVIAESGLNDPKVMRSDAAGGFGHDAAWADDFHHALRTLLTGDRDGYYAEFGHVEQLAKAFRRPHVHDGQYSTFRRRRFGAPAEDVPPHGFVVFSANHDQIGNRAFGDRLPHEVPGARRDVHAVLAVHPARLPGRGVRGGRPFQFFTDHIDEDIAEATRNGRREEFASFAAFSGEDVPDPQALETFERSKLTAWRTRRLADVYRRMLRLRRELPPRRRGRDRLRCRRPVVAGHPRAVDPRVRLRGGCPARSWAPGMVAPREPRRLARTAFPPGSHVGRPGHQLSLFSEHADARRAVPVRRRRPRGAHPGRRAHGVQLALLRPGAGPATRYGYRVHGPYEPERGPPLQPVKLLIDPYAKAIEGPSTGTRPTSLPYVPDPEDRRTPTSSATTRTPHPRSQVRW
jgi:hypothetical protein